MRWQGSRNRPPAAGRQWWFGGQSSPYSGLSAASWVYPQLKTPLGSSRCWTQISAHLNPAHRRKSLQKTWKREGASNLLHTPEVAHGLPFFSMEGVSPAFRPRMGGDPILEPNPLGFQTLPGFPTFSDGLATICYLHLCFKPVGQQGMTTQEQVSGECLGVTLWGPTHHPRAIQQVVLQSPGVRKRSRKNGDSFTAAVSSCTWILTTWQEKSRVGMPGGRALALSPSTFWCHTVTWFLPHWPIPSHTPPRKNRGLHILGVCSLR